MRNGGVRSEALEAWSRGARDSEWRPDVQDRLAGPRSPISLRSKSEGMGIAATATAELPGLVTPFRVCASIEPLFDFASAEY